MYNVWLNVLLSLIAAGVGAYFGAYLKKKGENVATHEDINKLVEQVRAVTQTTKEIEAKISSDLWDRQKKWELKREILFEAAKRLSEIDNGLLTLQLFWTHKKDSTADAATWLPLEHEYVTAWQKTMRSFEEVETLVQVTCSREATAAFNQLGAFLRQTAAKITKGDLAFYDEAKTDREVKFLMAKLAIRNELGLLSPGLKFQSSGSSATPSPAPQDPK